MKNILRNCCHSKQAWIKIWCIIHCNLYSNTSLQIFLDFLAKMKWHFIFHAIHPHLWSDLQSWYCYFFLGARQAYIFAAVFIHFIVATSVSGFKEDRKNWCIKSTTAWEEGRKWEADQQTNNCFCYLKKKKKLR